MLRWLLQRGVVVIPKSVTPSRILENIDVFNFHLSDDDMVSIATLDRNESAFFSHRDPARVKWLSGVTYPT
ncbi:aldo/keto reductase [Pokkaliibacter sp. MBI-7]|uniref:aldo/keto reductase n=1 Tax=Pokkaliibacter sp. MBI-7 TaxID=3040600 RepID=UPI00244BEDD4|nr:aldo/keto reductase [Pokkaliibacter sp. MBI-7]MDH2436211.1 aldo/keto reductase [Pokkaliibacter sp. MBI-7]